jgi:SulP family sulfate permease
MRQLPRLIPLSVVIGLDGIGFAIALAALLFTGELSPGLGMAVTGALGCTILFSILVGWRSQLKISMACAQDVGAAILAASLIGAVSGVSPGSKVATAFAIVAAATLATAIIIFATGFLRAGRLVRFFPLEVLAGFMAATGCLLLMGGIAMVCQVEPSLHGVLSVEPSRLIYVMPAAFLAGLIYLAMAYLRKPFIVLANLFGAAPASLGPCVAIFAASLSRPAAAGRLVGRRGGCAGDRHCGTTQSLCRHDEHLGTGIGHGQGT